MIVQGWGRGSGTPGDDIILHDASYEATINSGGSIEFASGGTATGATSATSGPLSYTWLNDGTASDYQIYCQPTSGSVSGSATNSWLALSSTRSWRRGASFGTSTVTISIRLASSGTVLATASINLSRV